MKHLILCPEFPPAPMPPGGIGTYVFKISRLLAAAGETVHIIGRLWEGAPRKVEKSHGGRLVIHRVSIDQPFMHEGKASVLRAAIKETRGLCRWNSASEGFSWQGGMLAEWLVEHEGIDVVEAQEYHAPLYYFLLRRALGLGPKACPPCIIHLHSPSEFIFRYNEWDMSRSDYLTTKRMEDYTIASADAWLCPSHYLARQVEQHYRMESKAVTVIPLPIGGISVPERATSVWKDGNICYVGRLEPRKGVIEWVEAAVALSDEHPTAKFEFIGANCPYTGEVSMKPFLQSRIPYRLKSRFIFRGSYTHERVKIFLTKAKIGVVPSRWENFPNTCVEAMGSGIPVIASCDGGMVEMVRDGITGWIANESGSKGLVGALRRALSTPSQELAEMGKAASKDIRLLCDDAKVIDCHLDFRRRVLTMFAKRSCCLPANLPRADRPLAQNITRQHAHAGTDGGLAIVVTCSEYDGNLTHCLESIKNQTLTLTGVVLVMTKSTVRKFSQEVEYARQNGWVVLETMAKSIGVEKNLGVDAILTRGATPIGFVFLDSADRLSSTFAEECVSILRHCPDIGLLSPWTKSIDGDNTISTFPCPAFPYQLIMNETVPATVLRTEALLAAGGFRDMLEEGYEMWDLVNAVMAADWVGITVPALLSERVGRTDPTGSSCTVDDHYRMRQDVITRFPDLVAEAAQTLIPLFKCYFRPYPEKVSSERDKRIEWIKRPSDILRLPFRDQIKLVGGAIHDPRRASAFMLWHSRRAIERAGTWLIRSIKRWNC
jgi:glycogen synthase